MSWLRERLLEEAHRALQRYAEGKPGPNDAHPLRIVAERISLRPASDRFRELGESLCGPSSSRAAGRSFGYNVHLLWFDPSMLGIPHDRIVFVKKWDPDNFTTLRGTDARSFALMPAYHDCLQLYKKNAELASRVDAHVGEHGDHPRLWFKRLDLPTLDGTLTIEFGVLDYRTTRILAEVIDHRDMNDSTSFAMPKRLSDWQRRVCGNAAIDLWNMVVLVEGARMVRGN